jgi:hypothetical protein
LIVLALLFNELVMGPPLYDTALFQDHNAVTVFHGGQSVRYDKIGTALH